MPVAARIVYHRPLTMKATGLLLALLLPTLIVACGGGASAPPKEPDAKADKPAGGAGDEAAAKGAGKTLVEHHGEFMQACSAKMPAAPDFCECSWEQMTKLFTLDDMNAPGEGDPQKLAQLGDQVKAVCRSKIPEDTVKQSFTKSCTAQNAGLQPYCECTWTQLRKKLSAGELSDDEIVKTERFIAANKESVKTCGSKLPDDVARQGFLQGCTEKDPKLGDFCGCAWKQLRAEKSAAEIEAGFVDMNAARPKIEKACAKLRPQ